MYKDTVLFKKQTCVKTQKTFRKKIGPGATINWLKATHSEAPNMSHPGCQVKGRVAIIVLLLGMAASSNAMGTPKPSIF